MEVGGGVLLRRFFGQPGVVAVAAHRLVGNGRQDEQGGPHHQREHADVKKHGTGDVDVAQQRQAQVKGVAREKRVAHHDRPEPCGQGEEQPGADPAPRE